MLGGIVVTAVDNASREARDEVGEDFAVAVVDEVEREEYPRQRISIAY